MSLRCFAVCLFPTMVACGAAPDEEASSTREEAEQTATAFDPPPPPEGYTRIVAPIVTGIEPGADVIHCQYVTAPLDHDVDILDVGGAQSAGGHHAIAYATNVDRPVGTNGPCSDDDNLAGNFLGGVGGEAGGLKKLPENVAFRLPAGTAIMLNTHFLNTSNETVDGESVLDIKFAEVDPNRKIASLFVNGNFDFVVPPMGQASAVAECVVPHDIEFIGFSNHLHDQGKSIMTEIERTDGTIDMVSDDPSWSYQMQFEPPFRSWTTEEPLLLREGDTLRTHCSWNNSLNEELIFPREMCIGFGFFITTGTYTSPVCYNGEWIERE